ncbi:MAG: hypothetical protein HZB62_10785 [Nitrospirae bacterium]|nr:hypothetical protein [Nitrospirota bacterium]
MNRIIAVARRNGVDTKTGLDLKRGNSYQINEDEIDPSVFSRTGEDLGEEAIAIAKETKGKKIKEVASDEK